MDQLVPIGYGFLAGITVLIGAWSMYLARYRLDQKSLGTLQAMAGGILAYLALETGHEASEYVEGLAKPATLPDFLAAVAVTTAALVATFVVFAKAERLGARAGAAPSSASAFIVALSLGIHNVGEGFAIAASLLAGAVASAALFTVGFAVHNATEGFAIVGPLLGDRAARPSPAYIAGLSLLAGLPAIPGAAVYYTGLGGGLFIATLDTVATASIVYALLHVNLSALPKLGGLTSYRFWASLVAGVALAFATESILLFAMPGSL
ncbi:zinc transporter, ZIP family [Thermoproteus uzoniensis 768-20]|uniref:Zinc transporter, ZIP family n=1 Tax=Thermoproteus uzoniensis (strain 768-20) TaxID=999630 RepID=F2L6A9_THEU7|nr:ZIP family metal transporter [Thermoproteus uzoniensis]AEA12505.1 zinc transporter, ZIP family [Thermoproteus uzoniensis 768-20]